MRNKLRLLRPVVSICFALLFVSDVSGQTVFDSENDDGAWVVAAYLGGARTGAADLTISQPPLGTNLMFEDVRFSSRSFDPPLYYGLRGGYFLRRMRFLGFEAEFIHLKVFSNRSRLLFLRWSII